MSSVGCKGPLKPSQFLGRWRPLTDCNPTGGILESPFSGSSLVKGQKRSAMILTRRVEVSFRVLICLVLLYGTFLVGTRAVALWYFRQPPPDGLNKAIDWDPGNPMYYAALGRVLKNSTRSADPDQVVRLFEKATQLSPHNALYWAELGDADEFVGRSEDAKRAYEKAQKLFPNSPAINWRLGNFHIRRGETDRALPALEKVLLGDPSLRDQTFDLVWRAGAEPDQILTVMIPKEPAVLFHYLIFLCRTHRTAEAGQVWAKILALQFPFEPNAAFPYLEALIQDHRVEELVAAWLEVTRRHASSLRQPAPEVALVTNGSFENEILNGGLDWRVSALEGVVVSVDSLDFFDGTRALKISFDGKHNVDYHHVYQLVPVKPNTLYQFMGYIRTRDITTDAGLHFDLYDAYDPSRLFLSTQDLVGTASWTPEQLRFQTGPETVLLVIRLRRLPSTKFDNKIQGTAWVDRISITPAE